MQLNRENLAKINHLFYNNSIQDKILPVRVLQFGTGVLLRGLPAYCINKANQQGYFRGGIVMVKSTSTGDIATCKKQDCLYTIHTRGIRDGGVIEESTLVTSIQDVLDANNSWSQILELAKDSQINIIVSNTTENGIVDVVDNLGAMPPLSFPGKITSYLFHRFTYFGATADSRIIILPTELIAKNAELLKEIVVKQAQEHNLGDSFIEWLGSFVYFCNTLVDRIVPGFYSKPDLPYTDQLSIAVEPYFFWAIETDDAFVSQQLEFARQSNQIRLSATIADVMEIKVRVLNATHTLMAAMAILSKHRMVKETFTDPVFEEFLQQILASEIIPCLEWQGISKNKITQFSSTLIDRFKNPFIDHHWLSIAQNYHTKMKTRVLPLLHYWYSFQNEEPRYISFGIASYLCLLRQGMENIEPEITTLIQSGYYPNIKSLISDEELWGINLMKFNGLAQAIEHHINLIEKTSINHIIKIL